MSEKIRMYWEERAIENFGKNTATTDDIHLRDLEISTFIETICEIKSEKTENILDIGCGDGRSTLEIATRFPELHFLGIDFSETMIKLANENLETIPLLKNRVEFRVGDATKLTEATNGEKFGIIISDRCLINLDSPETQYRVISDISTQLIHGGSFIAIENFIDGQNAMNDARQKLGLPEIPIRWHNRYFSEDDFIGNSEKFFKKVIIKNFSSSYYFATRVIYSKVCQMRNEKPDYDNEIHQLATKLPWTGKFSPIKLAVMNK